MNREQDKKLEDAILNQFEDFLKKEEQYLAQELAGKDAKQVEVQLKWFTAYVLIKAVCTEIISPYCPDTDLVIDHFWQSYRSDQQNPDNLPTVASFFEWYCYNDEVFAYMK
jgi:hypothetical protein